MQEVYYFSIITHLNDFSDPGIYQSSQSISDDMVLQQGINIPVWGWADPGEHITARLGNHSSETVTSDNGIWKLFLGPLEAGGPYELVISCKKQFLSKMC